MASQMRLFKRDQGSCKGVVVKQTVSKSRVCKELEPVVFVRLIEGQAENATPGMRPLKVSLCFLSGPRSLSHPSA